MGAITINLDDNVEKVLREYIVWKYKEDQYGKFKKVITESLLFWFRRQRDPIIEVLLFQYDLLK